MYYTPSDLRISLFIGLRYSSHCGARSPHIDKWAFPASFVGEASIKYVRTEWGRGSENWPILRTNSSVDMREGGPKMQKIFIADVLKVSPLKSNLGHDQKGSNSSR